MVLAAFRRHDVHKSGLISKCNLRGICLGIGLAEEDLNSVLRDNTLFRNGMVDYEHFLTHLAQVNGCAQQPLPLSTSDSAQNPGSGEQQSDAGYAQQSLPLISASGSQQPSTEEQQPFPLLRTDSAQQPNIDEQQQQQQPDAGYAQQSSMRASRAQQPSREEPQQPEHGGTQQQVTRTDSTEEPSSGEHEQPDASSAQQQPDAGIAQQPDAHAKLLQAFRDTDTAHSGRMPLGDFLRIFGRAGISEEDMRRMLETSRCTVISANSDPEVDYENFLKWLAETSKTRRVMDASSEFVEETSPKAPLPTRGFGTWVDRCAQVLEARGEADFVQKKLIAAQVKAHLEQCSDVEQRGSPRGGWRILRSSVGGVKSQKSEKPRSAEAWDGAELMHRMIREGPTLSCDFVEEVLEAMLSALPRWHPRPLVRVNVRRGGDHRLVVVGDTHGQLKDVLLMLLLYGMPTSENAYLFNGDVADRGPNACEIFILLFVFMLENPQCLMMTRGNHEDENMNMMGADESGGFYDECLQKYGESVFMQFVEIFKLLPLAAVVNDEVFVVHGGLPRGPPPSLATIESLEYRHVCCPLPEAAVDKDRIFHDLLWSDPMEAPGHEPNPRGAGTLWGPDVTKAFLQANNLRWVIRSHQLPHDGERGWMEHHLGLVFTVFSASNYCGYEVNWGAVALLSVGTDGRLVQALREHNVPDLECLEELAALPWGEQREQRCQEIGLSWTDSDKIAVGERRVQLALRRLGGFVLEFKPELWKTFQENDPTNTGTITRSEWVECLISVCGDDLPWEEASKCWIPVDVDTVDYRKFLGRFKVVLSQEKWCAWKSLVIADVYEELLSRHSTAEDMLRTFDPSGDGMVSIEEFTALMSECCGGCLTEPQVAALSRTIFAHSHGEALCVHEFLSRFTMAFTQSKGMAPGTSQSHLSWCQTTIDQIGKLMMRSKHQDQRGDKPPLEPERWSSQPNPLRRESVGEVSSAVPPGRPTLSRATSVPVAMLKRRGSVTDRSSSTLVKAFQQLDESGDGLLQVEEFVRQIKALPGFEKIRHDGKPLDEDVLRSIAKAIAADQSDDGSINLLQFAQAFVVMDVSNTTDLADDLHEHILTFLYRHRHALRTACTEYDEDGETRVDGKDFRRALEAVNLCASTPAKQHLTRAQMAALVESITEDDGSVEYEAFLSSFEIHSN